jgi:hypothetical protein
MSLDTSCWFLPQNEQKKTFALEVSASRILSSPMLSPYTAVSRNSSRDLITRVQAPLNQASGSSMGSESANLAFSHSSSQTR